MGDNSVQPRGHAGSEIHYQRLADNAPPFLTRDIEND